MLLPWLATRLVVALAGMTGAVMFKRGPVGWDGPVRSLIPFFRWDSGYYLDIARNGYRPGPDIHSQAFFPLYPMLIRGTRDLLGGDFWAAFLVANLAFLGGLVLFYRVAREHLEPEQARVAVWALLLFPMSGFLSFPYAESLLFLGTVLALWLMDRRRWVLAGVVAAMASAARPPGIMAGLALAGELAWRLLPGRGAPAEARSPRRLLPILVGGLISTLGILLFALYLGLHNGDPLGFTHAQHLWQIPHRNPLFPLEETTAAIRGRNPFNEEALGLPVLVIFVASLPWVVHRLPWRYAVFAIGSVALAAWHGFWLADFSSVPRHLALIFPCFMVFGVLLSSQRWRWLQMPLLVVSGGLMFMYTALYASWHFVG